MAHTSVYSERFDQLISQLNGLSTDVSVYLRCEKLGFNNADITSIKNVVNLTAGRLMKDIEDVAFDNGEQVEILMNQAISILEKCGPNMSFSEDLRRIIVKLSTTKAKVGLAKGAHGSENLHPRPFMHHGCSMGFSMPPSSITHNMFPLDSHMSSFPAAYHAGSVPLRPRPFSNHFSASVSLSNPNIVHPTAPPTSYSSPFVTTPTPAMMDSFAQHRSTQTSTSGAPLKMTRHFDNGKVRIDIPKEVPKGQEWEYIKVNYPAVSTPGDQFEFISEPTEDVAEGQAW